MATAIRGMGLCLAFTLALCGFAAAQEAATEPTSDETISIVVPKPKEPSAETPKKVEDKKSKKKPDFPPIAEVTEDAEKMEGFLTLYKKKETLYAELSKAKFDKPFMLNVSIAKGVAQGYVVAGMTLQETPLYWRLADKKVFLVEKNVRHMASTKDPISLAVEDGFSDSIIGVFKIRAKTGSTCLIDLGDFLFTDYAEVGRVLQYSTLKRFGLDKNRTTWGAVKVFPENVTIEVNATFSGGSGNFDLRTVADSRSLPITIHYSFSKIPKTGYKPRLADPRMGHFLTALKDYSQKGPEEPFVRYINRWNLKKADPKAELSPPKKPIVFYIEKSVPYEYRPIVREGILEWNKAFEKAGYINAIEVRYQEEDATWSAEDVRYNTVRWMTGEATYAIGPSRVNPETGEIYDADILVASSWLQYFKNQYGVFFEPDPDALGPGVAYDTRKQPDIETFVKDIRRYELEPQPEPEWRSLYRCNFASGIRQQLGIAALAAEANGDDEPEKKGVPREYIRQALKELIMHEVGHTLGLRHNFKASSSVAFKDLHNKALADEKGLAGSVMDYSLVNIAPEGVEQGYYFTPTIGPWDYLAIEYGYKDVSGAGKGKKNGLSEIAARTATPEYAYATDWDVATDIDPLTNRRDMSADPLEFAKERMGIMADLWDGLADRVIEEGEGYQKLRTAFLYTLRDAQQAAYFASRFVGGVYFHRNHKGDPGELPVFEVVPYEKQKQALQFVCDDVFADGAFEFDPELLARLAPNRWDHWGSIAPSRMDLPIHDQVLRGQLRILGRILSANVLQRIHDSALYVTGGNEVMTIAELYQTLNDAIWSELKQDVKAQTWSSKTPFVSSYRRNLQRAFLKYFLLQDVLQPWANLPRDVRSVAWFTLTKLKQDIDTLIENIDGVQIDALSEAHLRESQARMQRALEAAFSVRTF